ncbi:hypothetical protein MBLNU459_g5160t1 [Dothideomycetes sp. NU459]
MDVQSIVDFVCILDISRSMELTRQAKAKAQYDAAADALEKHIEGVADQLRDSLPAKLRPPPPPPPPRILAPATYWHAVKRWISQNRALAAGITCFVGTGAVLLFLQRQSHVKKRRAKRTSGGARTEVVVIAGSFSSPYTTAIALDLERRGFIVYVVTSTPEDEQHIRSQSRVDLLPFNLDLVHPEMAQEQVARFHHFMSRHHQAFEGAPSHRLTLAGVVLVPDTSSPVKPVSELTAEVWSTALNAKVLRTIATTQLLMPLVTDFQSRVLFVTPSVVSSLRLPHYSIESTVSASLEAFASSLAAELSQKDIHLCHFKLGNIETGAAKARKDDTKRFKGTSIRKLHESVFDALHAKNPSRTWYVGRGSMVYSFIGGFLPGSLVGWMMGVQKTKMTPADDVVLQDSQGSDDESIGKSLEWEKVDQTA